MVLPFVPNRCFLPLSGRFRLGLASIEGGSGTDKVLDRGLVNTVALMDVNGASFLGFKARVEQTPRVFE